MRNLWLSSALVWLVLLSCSTVKYKGWQDTPTNELTFERYFSVEQNSAKYKAEVSIYGKYFSGLLFFKFTNDTTCHVAFLTVPGAKLFDMELTSRTDTVYECLAQLNKPGVIRTIQKDIRTFIMLDDYQGATQCVKDKGFEGIIWKRQTPEYVYYYYQPTGKPVNRIELLTNKLKKQVELTAGNFQGSLPSTVHIRGKYTLTIHLMQL